MATNINNGMCRCCASEGTYKHLSSEYQWMGETEVYADMLRDCFDINISMNEDGNDGGICEVCITQLRNAANFKKQVLHTEERFKNRLASGLLKNSIIKVEVNALEYDNNSEDNNLSEDFSTSEYMVPIKSESDEGKSKKRTRATTSRAKKPKVEEAESSTKSIRIAKEMRSQTKTQLSMRLHPCNGDKEYEPSEIEKHRSNIRLILESSNATPIRLHNGLGYSCNFCPNQYVEACDLKSHILETHNVKKRRVCMDHIGLYCFSVKLDITWLFCTLCDMSMENLDDLIGHLVDVHNKIYYSDVNCRMIPFKFEDDILRCALCFNVFSRFKALLEHMNTHMRNFVCDECDAGYVTNNMLRLHKQIHKTGHFQCRYCERVYDTQRKTSSHEKAFHRYRYKVNKCGICKERFNGFFLKEKHMSEVHGVVAPKLVCLACDQVFDNKQKLTTHTKRDHLMERRHKCEHCDMSFYNSKGLKDHVVKHSQVKKYQCDICKKSYVRKCTLREHLRIHTDERRFGCEYCGERFVQKVSFQRHLLSKHNTDRSESEGNHRYLCR